MSGAGEGRVTGIGGVFFRAPDHEALVQWYKEMLDIPCHGAWPQEEGISVFAPFAADTDYWPADRPWMLNLRVRGLDALIARLEAAGVEVQRNPDWDMPEIGRFVRITDPVGTPIELWEPVGEG